MSTVVNICNAEHLQCLANMFIMMFLVFVVTIRSEKTRKKIYSYSYAIRTKQPEKKVELWDTRKTETRFRKTAAIGSSLSTDWHQCESQDVLIIACSLLQYILSVLLRSAHRVNINHFISILL